MSGQKFKYILGVKRDFGSKMKSIFFIFKGLSLAKDFLRPDSAPLKDWNKSFATPLKINAKKTLFKRLQNYYVSNSVQLLLKKTHIYFQESQKCWTKTIKNIVY